MMINYKASGLVTDTFIQDLVTQKIRIVSLFVCLRPF
jgi:hypothetical protein